MLTAAYGDAYGMPTEMVSANRYISDGVQVFQIHLKMTLE